VQIRYGKKIREHRIFELQNSKITSMLTLKELSDADIQRAKYEKDHYPIPSIRKRFNVIYLIHLGYNRDDVSEIACVHRNSIITYIKKVNATGLDSLTELHYKGAKSALFSHKSSIETEFKAKPPRCSAEAAARIETMTGIKLSACRVRVFMRRIGMKCSKAGHIPAKADVEKQAIFKEKVLDPLIKLAQEGKAHLFFVDSAHFILQPFVCMLWCFSRVFIKAASGRNRINVLGALHATTLQLETVINTEYINALTIIELLHQIAKNFAGLPIHIVLDNARYQHCRLVIQTAKELGIELVFLPPYSPNLNLIERLWKFIKKKTLYGHFYETAKEFHHAINQAVQKIKNKEYEQDLKTLLTLKFQTFAQNQAI
jgi:transposase